MPGDSKKPLAGKRVLVTRAREQAAEFVAQLEGLGAEVLGLPTVSFTEPDDLEALDHVVMEMDKFDWVLFTSRNAVSSIAKRFAALKLDHERLNQLMLVPQVAVIGPATSDEAWSVGFIPAHEAAESRGEVLAAELADKVKGKRVLLPRSDKANPALPAALRVSGAEVVEVIAYRTTAPDSFDAEVIDAVCCAKVDVITVFSASSYKHLVDKVGLETLNRSSGNVAFASIGPVTSRAIRDDGLSVEIESPSASSAALAEAIVNYFERRAVQGAGSR